MSVYLLVLLRLMKLALAEKIDVRSPEVREALGVLSEQTRAVTQLAVSPDHGIYVSDRLPIGYLIKSWEAWTVAIPWPLVESCPSDDLLSEFCNFASEASVGSDSIICISGTSARAGAINQIGDIDLSEYVLDSSDTIPARYVGLLTMRRSATLDVEAKIFSNEPENRINIRCPWPDHEDKYETKHNSFLEKVQSFQTKIDFIGISRSFGYIPVTNMIFPCGDLSSLGAGINKSVMAYSSFSFQEAVILKDDGSSKVWPLVDVNEYVYYVRFLIHDTLNYIEKRPVKALKRASALAKMLRIDEFDLEFDEILRSEFANHDAVMSRVDEVRRLAAMRAGENPSCFEIGVVLASLDKVAHDAGLSQSELSFERFRCRQVVEQLLNRIRSYVREVDFRLETDLFGASKVGIAG